MSETAREHTLGNLDMKRLNLKTKNRNLVSLRAKLKQLDSDITRMCGNGGTL